MISNRILIILLGCACVFIEGCATSSPIQRYSESRSHFSVPPTTITNSYPATNIYRIYERASSGFVPIGNIRRNVEVRAEAFAKRQGKSFVVLGEKISEPPYILGNFPRIEIVFALIDLPTRPNSTAPVRDIYADLEKLKKLLDQGVISQPEFERMKEKILQQL